MRLRDPHTFNEDPARNRLAPDDAGGAADTDELRGAGETFLAAADEAINRALSGNSEQFLAQNRQLGGQ
jgi:hypothetical protein